MPMPKWLANSFSQVFQLDGYDENFKTINGVKVKNLDAESYQAALIYHQSVLVRILTFFGISMRMRFGQEVAIGGILATAFLNFIGWPEKNTSNAQFLLMPFKLVANLLNLVFTPIVHLLMLVTEFLPLALQKLCNEKKDEVDNWFGKKILGLIAGIMGITHFIGRAITSPISGVRQAYEEGREYGFILAGVSLLFSVGAWTAMIFVAPILLPQAWTFVSANFPAVANALSTIYSSVANLVSPIITPAIEFLTPHLMPYLMPVMGWMATTAAPWLTSFFALFGFTGTIPGAAVFVGAMGAAAGVLVTTVGAGINLLYRAIADALTGRRGPEMREYHLKAADDQEKALLERSNSVRGLMPVELPVDRENLTTAKLSEVLGSRVPEFEGLELTERNQPLLNEEVALVYESARNTVRFIDNYRDVDDHEQRIIFSPRGN